ncbi:MAG: FKBP-type peptidyl-prolyl cis-trans isomerase [Bacteroidetes bacterium]|nr:MAG: FKBP-type peptidyl-prolyl cis-trans isomerase [Bacteroidota bacterium]
MVIKTLKDTVSYGVGFNVAQSMKKSGLGEIDLQIVYEAMKDAFTGKSPLVSPEASNAAIEKYIQEAQNKMAESQKGQFKDKIDAGQKFLDENKKQAGVITLPSGLQYKVITEGTGAMPNANSTVLAHYEGRLLDGTIFDSSYKRGEPLSIGVGQVIKGWTEALQLMKAGSKWQLYIPYNLAYGERGAGGSIGGYETLIFDVELISIQ